jgi:quinohemoprotein amine dehydrogenase
LKYKRLSKIGFGALFSSLQLFAIDAQVGKEIVNSKCIACHIGNLNEGLSRISDQRKTPEGWYMTIKRMQREHGLSITSDEEANAIKYLSDYQGLTPDEIKPYTYVLDKIPNVSEENKNDLLTEMCVRCHSEARIGLQRRTADEWSNLIHFHVGQYATLELQAKARDKDCFGVAQKEVVPQLAKKFGKDKEKFDEYKKSIKDYKLPSKWVTYGHTPGIGDFTAILTLINSSDESYALLMDYKYANGEEYKARGIAILYGGTELRGSFEENGVKFSQILHIDPKTNSFEGRMFEVLHPENGSILKGISTNTKDVSIIGVYPMALKIGEKTILSIAGTNLSKEVKISNNIKVLKTIKHNDNEIILEVETDKNIKPSQSNIHVGNKVFKNSITLYDNVDYLKVTPEYGIARIGGERNDKILKQFSTFEAIGFTNGIDGKKGTEDDINLGVLPVTWNLEPYDKTAEEEKDIEYAGMINRYTGKFTPSEAGLNPKRKHSTNNVGNLNVIATYQDKNKQVEEKSHLVVSVPKYVNPPIN